ncbi:MAG: hypothetical protein U1G07_09765 [Verrucomicrobiota bacterium]
MSNIGQLCGVLGPELQSVFENKKLCEYINARKAEQKPVPRPTRVSDSRSRWMAALAGCLRSGIGVDLLRRLIGCPSLNMTAYYYSQKRLAGE